MATAAAPMLCAERAPRPSGATGAAVHGAWGWAGGLAVAAALELGRCTVLHSVAACLVSLVVEVPREFECAVESPGQLLKRGDFPPLELEPNRGACQAVLPQHPVTHLSRAQGRFGDVHGIAARFALRMGRCVIVHQNGTAASISASCSGERFANRPVFLSSRESLRSSFSSSTKARSASAS